MKDDLSPPEAGALSDSICWDPHSAAAAAAANGAEAAGLAHVITLKTSGV